MTENRGRLLRQCQQLTHRFCPGFKSEIAKSAVSRVHGDASTTQRLLIALMTELAQRSMLWT
ncbi:Uncharacterised protein [Vibrio cholerae]|nr:Uncharacterised protein [Vibrio cholerae]